MNDIPLSEDFELVRRSLPDLDSDAPPRVYEALARIQQQFETLQRVATAASAFESSFQRSLGSASVYDIDQRNEKQAELRVALNALDASSPADEPGLLDTAEGLAISDAADEINREGEAYQEELQRLRDSQRLSVQEHSPASTLLTRQGEDELNKSKDDAPAISPVTCDLCNGTGKRSERYYLYHPLAQGCSKCNGTGEVSAPAKKPIEED